MLENIGRLTVEHDDGSRVVAENVGQLTIETAGAAAHPAEAVRNGSRTSADQAEERGFDSRPPLHQTHDFAAAGRHGNHRRWQRPDPACQRCVAEGLHRPDIAPISPPIAPPIAPDRQAMISRSDRPDRPDIAPILRSNDDDRTSFVDSPSDLPLSYAVLLRKYTRGGQRQGHVRSGALASIRAVLACSDPGHDDRWCASVLDDARGNAVRRLEETHAQLHAPPPPDPEVQAEAAEAERRRQTYALRQQLDTGLDELGRPLGDVARYAVERQLRRLEASPQQPQGP